MNAIHRDFLELAATAIDFELSAPEQTRLDAHLATCAACRRRVAGMRADDDAIHHLPAFELAPAVATRLHPRNARRTGGPSSTFRLLLIAGALALLATTAVAVGAELIRRQLDDRLVVVPRPEVVTRDDPSESPATSIAPTPVDPVWRSIELPADMADEELELVHTTVGGGLLVVGCLLERPVDICREPAAWRSEDGLTWSSPATLPLREGEETIRVRAATMFGDRLVATGIVGPRDGSQALSSVLAAFWWSDDGGATWIRAASADDPSLERSEVLHMQTVDDHLVAVGSGIFGENSGLRAWTSADGQTWIAAGGPVDPENWLPAQFVDVPDEGLLAWGYAEGPAPGGTRWWRSPDRGFTWESIAEPEPLAGATISWVQVNEGGLAAHGTDGEPGATVPSSWSRASTGVLWRVENPLLMPEGVIRRTIAVGHGTVAATTSGQGDGVSVWYLRPTGDWGLAAEIEAAEVIGLAQHPVQLERIFLLVREMDGREALWTGVVDWTP